jgi:hypothetical protein
LSGHKKKKGEKSPFFSHKYLKVPLRHLPLRVPELHGFSLIPALSTPGQKPRGNGNSLFQIIQPPAKPLLF